MSAGDRLRAGIRGLRPRSVLLYALWVGVPILLLLVVLAMGRDLVAPHDIGGYWRVDEGSTCGLGQGEEFRIVQSGQFVVVRLADRSPLHGRLTGDRLAAVGGTREASAPGCGERPLHLDLRLSRSGTVLEGTGGVDDCSACPPRPIRATRSID